VFQISGRKISKVITIFFWKGKVTSLTNLRDLAPPSAAANCWDSKDPSGNLTSINVLIVKELSPHHKLHVNYILYRGADKSLARPTSLSMGFSVQGTGDSPMGPDP
jgi:hypothetical protein